MTRSEILLPTVEELGELTVVGGATIKEFFKDLLLDLWRLKEEFNPQKPWGESNWQNDVYIALIEAGFIEGNITDARKLKDFDKTEADRFINWVIKDAFSEN